MVFQSLCGLLHKRTNSLGSTLRRHWIISSPLIFDEEPWKVKRSLRQTWGSHDSSHWMNDLCLLVLQELQQRHRLRDVRKADRWVVFLPDPWGPVFLGKTDRPSLWTRRSEPEQTHADFWTSQIFHAIAFRHIHFFGCVCVFIHEHLHVGVYVQLIYCTL